MTTMNETARSIPTRTGTLHVRVTGHGQVAVLWHSLFADSRSWYRVEPALARQRTLVLIDGPSHGASQPARQLFTLADCADAAMQVLDQLDMTGPVDWLGSAWGGHVGMVLAAGQPQRMRSLATLASPAHALNPGRAAPHRPARRALPGPGGNPVHPRSRRGRPAHARGAQGPAGDR